MPRIYFINLIIIILLVRGTKQDVDQIIKKRNSHIPREISNDLLPKISDMKDINHFDRMLDNILITRVVGTEAHEKVKNFIAEEMKKLNWNLKFDEFDDSTPLGRLNFTNIIATLNPEAERFLIFACHYDSKYFPDSDKEFLGATDSACSCSMLINIAFVMRQYFEKIKNNNSLSIMMIFFDGEEAFVQWTATDSIYGSRHLAEKWSNENFLHKIDMLVLLDLIGAPDPTFYGLNEETLSWYARLSNTEEKLSNVDLLARYTTSGVTSKNPNKYFQEMSVAAMIEDDHLPFMKRGVPILHLIPIPFPTVWHKFEDDRKAIDVVTVENIMKILRIFIIEYLNIDID